LWLRVALRSCLSRLPVNMAGGRYGVMASDGNDFHGNGTIHLTKLGQL
jgi:hypothetical protein